jgi:hypothetical protein
VVIVGIDGMTQQKNANQVVTQNTSRLHLPTAGEEILRGVEAKVGGKKARSSGELNRFNVDI